MTDFCRFEEKYRVLNERINGVLTGEPKRLYEASRYLATAGGKRIRPLLCLLSCEAVGGDVENSLETSVAIELIHTFTLVHDDIMDRDELRRGVPSVHRIYGESTAILAGDLLFSKAFDICDPKTMKILAEASAEICEGQEMDMSFEGRIDVTEKEYLEMIRKKTAVLLQAATKAGALLGRGGEEQITELGGYGQDIGMAFQIHDDVLGVTADAEKLGKPVGSDIVEGKKSLIVIKALEKLGGVEREKLLGILGKKDNTREEIDLAVKLFRDSGAIDYSKTKAIGFIDRARRSLKELPDTEAKRDLMDIADFVIDRNS
jgi:geranylgeranyl diphosphate synthase type I